MNQRKDGFIENFMGRGHMSNKRQTSRLMERIGQGANLLKSQKNDLSFDIP